MVRGRTTLNGRNAHSCHREEHGRLCDEAIPALDSGPTTKLLAEFLSSVARILGGMPSEAGYPANVGILSVFSFPYAIALPGSQVSLTLPWDMIYYAILHRRL